MGPGQKFFDPGWVKSIYWCSGLGWVSHLDLGLGNFPLKTKFSNFYLSGQKKNQFGSGQKVFGSKTGQLLVYCGLKVCSGQFSGHLYYTVSITACFQNFHAFFTLSLIYTFWFFLRSKSTWVKCGSASYLLRVKSKRRSDRVRAHL